MKYICLASLQHTGTWRLINWLRTHPEIGGFAHFHNLKELQSGTLDPNPHNEVLAPEGAYQLLHEHYGYTDRNWNWPTIDEQALSRDDLDALDLECLVGGIAPLRDPLLSLITRHNRHPELYPHYDLLEFWLNFVNDSDHGVTKTFVPIDRYDPSRMASALAGLGLSCPPEWLATLDPVQLVNTSGVCATKAAYASGDLNFIYDKMPLTVQALRRMAPGLRSFLEQQGYDDLIWYR